MNSKKPFIIVTAAYDYNTNISSIKNLYCEALEEAGAAPVVLPVSTNKELLDIYIEKCDGVMVIGGPDIDPVYFGEKNMPYNGDISPYRDVMELELVKKAVLKNKPVLGICRGAQIINVAMGGTLYQDIHAQIKDRELMQHSQSAPTWYATHEVAVKKASFLGEVFKAEKASVNSFHHQSVKDVAPDFEVTAWSEDGIIEAIEYNKNSFALGVQWHPEHLWKQDNLHRELFKKFINICSAKML
jgi:putative glutamine amidotransferase